MRFLAAALAFASACHRYEYTPPTDAPGSHDAAKLDGTTVDATLQLCRAAAGTANVTADDHGALQAWSRLHAGGTWFTGPVAPVAGPPMSVSLLFTDVDPLDRDTGWCCQSPGSACCPINGVIATSDGLASGGEVGAHTVMIKGLQNGFSFAGTITITSFVQPFEQAPGRIAGSISGSVGGQSVSGAFDNHFCAALLTQTI